MPVQVRQNNGGRENALAKLCKWLTIKNVNIEGCNLSTRHVSNGIGAVATRALEPDAVLFRIPVPLQLTADASGIGAALRERNISGWPALAIAIAYELSLGNMSRWAGYLAFLPRPEDNALHLPLQWSECELHKLTGTGLCARSGRTHIADYYQRIVTSFVQEHAEELPAGLSLSEFAHCGALVSAYSFSVIHDGKTVVAMVPIADALNADGPAASNARLEAAEDGSLQMVVTRAIAAGEEVMNTYGAFAESETLLRYGYIGRRTDSSATALTVREMFDVIEKEEQNKGGVQRAKLVLAMRKMAQKGIIVSAAPGEAAPFMDDGKVLPLRDVDEACEEMERLGLSPERTIVPVLERRLHLLRQCEKLDSGGKEVREMLARHLRQSDIPRVTEALRYISERTTSRHKRNH